MGPEDRSASSRQTWAEPNHYADRMHEQLAVTSCEPRFEVEPGRRLFGGC